MTETSRGDDRDDHPRHQQRHTEPERSRWGVTDLQFTREWHRRVSGAPVWSGFAVALAVWVLLEVVLAAIDLVPLGIGTSQLDVNELWWTGAASVVALFVGGLVAGAASRSATQRTRRRSRPVSSRPRKIRASS